MGKVTVGIQGYGEVVIERPKKLNKRTFADAVASAVAETYNVTIPNGPDKRFHPVLGVGGFDWDHESQRANVRQAPVARVDVQLKETRPLHLYLRKVWSSVQSFGRGIREAFY